ncbi:glycosyltransferase family 2 protein [Flavobacterium selenitireducens]|uniref:glycosyltransferase family 2 protein n=1 Tax=Flavobacterium selenitireducens TaxID=2722704 RepID=UPI00168A5B7E|nr:glycosyltransferase [Flavobacterium selenitireducens]MBD3583440.1 glycosyltransferase [Flavobacterium selenitireducens]
MGKTFSVLIPVYNREHLIGQTLDSILSQTWDDWECIVVDDGSTDGTVRQLEAYASRDKRIKWFARPEDVPKGPNGCRNFAFSKSEGRYVKFFDSDDLLHPDALLETAAVTADQPDVIVSALNFFDETGVLAGRKHNYRSDNLIADYICDKISWYVLQTWKRSFLNGQSELFDVRLRHLDDWDFNLRMLYSDPKIAYIDRPLASYRVHSDSLSQQVGKLNLGEIKSEFEAREKHVMLLSRNRKAPVALVRKYIRKRWAYILRQGLLERNSEAPYFFKKLLEAQFRSRDFYAMSRSVIGYFSFSLFRKGYKLLQP